MKAANNMLRLSEVRTPMFLMTFSSASFEPSLSGSAWLAIGGINLELINSLS